MVSKEPPLHAPEKVVRRATHKWVFKNYLEQRQTSKDAEGNTQWQCCGNTYECEGDMFRHCSVVHAEDIAKQVEEALAARSEANQVASNLSASSDLFMDMTSYKVPDGWPDALGGHSENVQSDNQGVTVLLFYVYVDLDDPGMMAQWLRYTCTALSLFGKIRVAGEGINGSVAGTDGNVRRLIGCMLANPLLKAHMVADDFKKSTVSNMEDAFDDLTVKVCDEIVPMGVDPHRVKATEGGKHLTPAEFHEMMGKIVEGDAEDAVVIDCRNFYESDIGQFVGAVKPRIRKFKYWPDYLEANRPMLQDKTVLMYCTGGIRCERGSAYLRQMGICKDIYQLKGGIHKYLEEYPDGLYRGKLYVFDKRQTMAANDDVLGRCWSCGSEYDTYEKCTSPHCHILLLSCPPCRSAGHTYCCATCKENTDSACGGQSKPKEQCTCTNSRPRIPVETVS